jgi:hypothetical protein
LTAPRENEYLYTTLEVARTLWGEDETKKMMQQLEITTSAVWRISQLSLDIKTEPAIKLRYRENP